MWRETELDMPPAEPVPPVLSDAHERVAEHFGVSPKAVWCGSLDTVVGALPSGRVALAQPCAPEIGQCVVASGRRYVDAGRDFNFHIHPAGWRYAVALPTIDSAWLMLPNEPLGNAPEVARIDEALDAETTVILDGRYDLRPFRTDIIKPKGKLMWLRSTDVASGHATGSVMVISTVQMVSSLGESNDVAMGQHARWLHNPSMNRRILSWAKSRGLDPKSPHVANGSLSGGIWHVVRGIGSIDITINKLPLEFRTGWRITNSSHWTWRDGVRLTPQKELGE